MNTEKHRDKAQRLSPAIFLVDRDIGENRLKGRREGRN
jgi:hypothetical protein